MGKPLTAQQSAQQILDDTAALEQQVRLGLVSVSDERSARENLSRRRDALVEYLANPDRGVTRVLSHEQTNSDEQKA